jgi:hypothetical protein
MRNTLKPTKENKMPFLQKQITEKTKWYEVDTSFGTDFVELDVAGPNQDKEGLSKYCEGAIYAISLIEGYGARLSAPGYLDRTDWGVYDTEKEANEALDDMFGND